MKIFDLVGWSGVLGGLAHNIYSLRTCFAFIPIKSVDNHSTFFHSESSLSRFERDEQEGTKVINNGTVIPYYLL